MAVEAAILANTGGFQLNYKSMSTKALALTLPLALAASASAQNISPLNSPTLSYSRSTDRETWHNVMIISAVVLFAGLLSNDNTMTALGGAGVILSLVETNGNSFAFRAAPALDFAHFGKFSLGVQAFDQTRLAQGFVKPQPGLILQTRIRF